MSDENRQASPLTEYDLAWPVPGDRLFQPSDCCQDNACIDFRCNRWDLYATGFKLLADIGAKRVLENRQGIDTLVYPIIFTYRHYLELRIKEVIVAGQELLNEHPNLKHVHRLDELWKCCRTILEQVWPGGPKQDFELVEDCIAQFCEADPHSMSFRYPFEKDGNPTLEGFSHIGIRNFYEVMQRVGNFFDTASFGISAYIQQKDSAF
jgi:hypothetical protein